MDAAWALAEGLYGGALKHTLAGWCGLLPDGPAAQGMARIGKRPVSDSRVWRLAQNGGRALQRQATLDQPPEAPPEATGESAPPDPHRLSLAGGMVNRDGAGWQALTVGLVGTGIADPPASPDQGPLVHTPAAHSCAVVGEGATFTPTWLALARRMGVAEAAHPCITAAGAAWMWNLADPHVPASVQRVDGYHARQQRSLAAQALFPDRPARANAWCRAHTDALVDGPLTRIVAARDQAGLADSPAYFQTHPARMPDADCPAEGVPIGSASLDSEVTQLKHRLDGPGMSWSRPGAQNMILIRAAVLDGAVDMRWSRAA